MLWFRCCSCCCAASSLSCGELRTLITKLKLATFVPCLGEALRRRQSELPACSPLPRPAPSSSRPLPRPAQRPAPGTAFPLRGRGLGRCVWGAIPCRFLLFPAVRWHLALPFPAWWHAGRLRSLVRSPGLLRACPPEASPQRPPQRHAPLGGKREGRVPPASPALLPRPANQNADPGELAC